MNLLILGGTRFVGRHLVEALVERGHRVTLFNRGQTVASLPGGVEWRQGDRRADLSALDEGRWDAVIDTCGYLPGEVRASAERLAGRVDTYAFISSVSAYASHQRVPREDEPLATIPDPDTEVVDGRTYGALKALCEARVLERFGPDASLIIRPGLVVGPHDPTQRFTWWPARVSRAAEGEPVLVGGSSDTVVQWIDARDLARFIVSLLERRVHGTFNVVDTPTTMGALLALCAAAAGVAPSWRWVDVPTLVAQGVTPWSEQPLVLPPEPAFENFCRVDATRARAAGLSTRDTAETVADTLAWWRALPDEARHFDKAGLAPERERELLARLGP